LNWLQIFNGGFGLRAGVVSQTPDTVSIRLFLRMKLGFAGQLFAVLSTRNGPPWATLMIDYTFDLRFLTAQADFHSTAVPSQRRYINWRLESDYEMEKELTSPGYRGFVGAGGCQDALAACV
jgi:hypothetical protein